VTRVVQIQELTCGFHLAWEVSKGALGTRIGTGPDSYAAQLNTELWRLPWAPFLRAWLLDFSGFLRPGEGPLKDVGSQGLLGQHFG